MGPNSYVRLRRLETIRCDERPRVGDPLLQHRRQGRGTRRRQDASLSANEQGIAKQVAEAHQHATDRRLGVTKARGCSRNISLFEQCVEHDEQVEINFPDIGHSNIRTIIL